MEQKPIVSFPHMGIEYTNHIKQCLEEIGIEVRLSPPISNETVKIGVRNSAEMMCFISDTKITTIDYTSRNIQDIKEGELVLTHKGRFRKVVKTMSRRISDKIIKVSCGGLLNFSATTNHPILALKKGKIKQRNLIPKFTKAKYLKKGDYLCILNPKNNIKIDSIRYDNKYKNLKFINEKFKINKDTLRLLGYWLAEGCIIYNRRETKQVSGLSFVFSSKEQHYINDIKNILKNNFNCSISERYQKITVKELLVYSKSLATMVLLLCNEKSDKKRLDERLMNLKPELQLEILKGFFRGDGHFNLSKKDKRYIIATVSKDLAQQLFWMLIRNNIKPEFTIRTPRDKNKKLVYFIRLWRGDISRLENIKIIMKRNTFQHCIKTENYIFVKIKKIDKYNYNGNVYNLAVEEDNSYVANNLAVHNCYPYKITLGNFVEALNNGANVLIQHDNCGQCRQKHYYKIQELTLKKMGYKFKMYNSNYKNIFYILKKISGCSTLKSIMAVKKIIKGFKQIDEKRYKWKSDKINIGIIGEIYVCCEPKVNYDIENKIKKLGANPYNMSNLTNFIYDYFLFNFMKKRKYKKIAKGYLNKKLGGHGVENIYNLLWMIDNKLIDGIVHIMPLSCFIGDTKITLENFKSKKIKDIKIGEKVLTHKGRFRKVTHIFKRVINENISEIDCGGLIKFEVTSNHPIFTLKRKDVKRKKKIIGKPRFIEIKELRKGDFIGIPKPKEVIDKHCLQSDMINKKIPKYKDMIKFEYNKDMLRLLGYYLAEGCVQYDRHNTRDRKYLSGLRFTFNKKETNFINDIIKIIEKNKIECYCKVYLNKSRPNVADLSIYNRSFAYLLKRLGGNYCDKKEIHKEIMNLKPELQLEVVKGFFRGDGCFTDKFGETTYRAVTTSYKLAEQLFWILIRNNIKCSFSEQNIRDRKKSWMIKISNSEGIKRLKDDLVSPKERMDNVRFVETENYFFIPIKNISKRSFYGEVYNLEIEEDQSYIANFMAVHNCMPESTVQVIIDIICKDNNIPIQRFMVDEVNNEANVNMRIETLIEQINELKT